MTPHMTEVQRPQSTNSKAESGTCTIPKPEPVKTGIETLDETGESMAPMTRRIATLATTISCVLLDTVPLMKLDTNLPISIRNQYVPATKPATVAAVAGSKPAPFAEPSAR